MKVNLSLKSYLSKGRRNILLGSLLVGTLLIVLIHFFLEHDSLIGDLFINLAATAFTTAIALTYLDYILRRDEMLDVADGYELAEGELSTAVWKINNTLARMYGFDFKTIEFPKRNKTSDQPLNLLTFINKKTRKYVSQIEESGDMKTINQDNLSLCLTNFRGSIKELDSLVSRYSYAISNKERSALLKLRKLLNTLVDLTELFGDIVDNDPETQSAIKKAAIEVNRELKADFLQYLD